MSNFAWVTLTTNDTYSLGALVLAHSLRRVGTKHQLAVLVTPGVSESMRTKLQDVYNVVQEVNVLDSQDAANLALLARPELGVTFTKLHCWRLLQFEKCVFLDADTLVLQNSDELFEREELSAAPDVSWPDCFNSGVFVYRPSLETFNSIIEFALKNGSFDGGDQGLLNQYFADWATKDIQKHLPFIYNVTAYASYCYLPAFKQFRDKIKILHFAGKMKPWLIQFNSESRTASTPTDYAHAADLIQLWWNIFCDNVHQKLTENMNFWPQITAYWKIYQQNYFNENYIQTHHQCHPIQDHDKPTYISQSEPVNVKEFHDPWEDYYEKLERQSTIIEQIEQNEAIVQASACSIAENSSTITFQDPIERTEDVQSNEYVSYEQNEIIHEDNRIHSSTTDELYQQQPVASSQNEQYSNTDQVYSSATHRRTASTSEDDEDFLDIENNSERLSSIDTNLNNNCVYETVSDEETDEEAGLAGALSQLRLGQQRTPEQEAYEALMRRQCWEAGQVDYSGKDSFDNIWKKITETLETKPAATDKSQGTEMITSADIEDGKTEYDPETNSTIQYKVIDGGYEVITTTTMPNGAVKTQKRTFWDPKPVSEEDMIKEQENKKIIRKRFGKEIRIDKNTTMLTREIEGGYEEVYTTTNADGTKTVKTKTFFDSVPAEDLPVQPVQDKPKRKPLTKKSSVDSTDSTESRKLVQTKNIMQNVNDQQSNFKHESTIEESRRVTQNIEYTENNRTVRKNSLQEQNIKSIKQTSNVSDNRDAKKKGKKTKSNIPPPPPDFIENDTTTVSSRRVPGGIEYTYSTQLESGKTITTQKTIYEEEEVELTEEEIKQYKKTLKDAEKHKNVTTTKKLRSESGTKKIVPSENPGDVTTVETIKIDGGTEYHYTTVTAEGIVKKAVKTIYDPVPSYTAEDEEEEEIVEEYEEEIIEPGDKIVKTIESVKKLPTQFKEEVTITSEKKEKKVKRSMMMMSN